MDDDKGGRGGVGKEGLRWMGHEAAAGRPPGNDVIRTKTDWGGRAPPSPFLPLTTGRGGGVDTRVGIRV